jgi:hypothetical protein
MVLSSNTFHYPTGEQYRKLGAEPVGQPAFMYAVGVGAGNNPDRVPDLDKGKYEITLGELAMCASKVSNVH